MNGTEQRELNAAQAESVRIVSLARTRTVAALAVTMLLGAMVTRDAHRMLQDAIKANSALEVADAKIMEEMQQKGACGAPVAAIAEA